MDKLDAMLAFSKVASLGSYAEAGRQMGLTRSAVSKGVLELERILGARLLDRTTRRVSVTEAGRAYLERCLSILAQIEETELQVSRLHDEPKGTLKLNAPMSFGVRQLAPAIGAFMAAYPDVKAEITLNDRFVDPIEEGFDLTIRIAELQDSSLIARKLGPARRVLAASPDYLGEHGWPETPDDLARHRCLNYGATTIAQRWSLRHGDKLVAAPINSTLCANNGDVLREAALAGRGIANLPTFLLGEDLLEGRLRAVLTDHPPTELGVYALYAPHKYLAAKTRVFIDFLVERFGPEPPWDAYLKAPA